MKTRLRVPVKTMLLAIAIAAVVALTAPPIAAGVDISFGAKVPIGDEGELFVAISSNYFDRDRDVVRRVAVRYQDPDDLAVALFIGKHSGRSAEEIWQLRREGLTWWEISAHLRLSHDIWFVPVRRAPGPPYGKAYGYWKKNRNRQQHAFELSDVDARNLVAVRVISDYYGVSAEVAMQKRASGNLRHVLAHEYRNRHGKGPKNAPKHAHKQKHKNKR